MGAQIMNEDERRKLPDVQKLARAGEIQLKDKDGKEIPFKSLFTGKPDNERQLVIFIRHFFCGTCEQYVQALGEGLPPKKLGAANTTLTIIGCGQPVCIESYAKRTNCPFTIYADPSVETYKILDMTSTLKSGNGKPEYVTKSLAKNVLDSIWNAISSGHPISSGPSAQNGGEWLFQAGELKWCSRMRNTADHSEVKELKEVLEIQD